MVRLTLGGKVLPDLALGFIGNGSDTAGYEGQGIDLFRRLSRTPGLRQRERFCVEVLASVLCSAPSIRRGFVDKLAEMVGWEMPSDIEQCQIRLETERVIRDAKRIDLTVEIVRRSETGPERLAAWAFEAKVDSGLNESLDSNENEEVRLRSQLDFYSEWLEDAFAKHTAGFVLGKRNLRAELPPNHRKLWYRLTWLGVAELLKSTGDHLDDSNYERVLVESYYSFVRDYIGGVNLMGESDFRIDDVLFLRALASAGYRAVETFDSLVSNLEECLQSSGLLTGGIKHQKWLLRRHRRSDLWATISDGNYPIIMVGVRSEDTPVLFVVIETDPRHPAKNHVMSVLAGTESGLNDRSQELRSKRGNHWPETKWCVDPEPEWWDLEANWPLEQLLSADAQTDKVRQLVSDALKVLSESGVVEGMRRL